MLVLGLDTALKSCAVAILREGRVLGDNFTPLEKGHAEHLPPMAAKTLREAGVRAGEIERIGVVIGPGGFAGVRVGLAFARGLAVGTRAAVIGVTSLEALAADLAGPGLRAAVLDARRGQVYAALYAAQGEPPLIEPFVADPGDALARLEAAAGREPLALCGDGAALLGPLPGAWRIDAKKTAIDAKTVCRLAAAAPAPAGAAAPLYLRPPDAAPAKPSPFAGLFVEEAGE